MSKGLIFVGQELCLGDGVTRKVYAQKRAFDKLCDSCPILHPVNRKRGVDYYIGDSFFVKIIFVKGLSRVMLLFFYAKLFKYIKVNKLSFIYIRYFKCASRPFINLLRKIHNIGCKVVLEIPTFPYDGETSELGFRDKISIFREKYFRAKFSTCVDFVVTTSTGYDRIFNCETLCISNAVDPQEIPVHGFHSDSKCIHMIAVANIAFWHGLDRIIIGFAEYYAKEHSIEVYLDIVGDGDTSVISELQKLIVQNHLDVYVKLLGRKNGEELDKLFDSSDLAIGCLGCHRKSVGELKSLKNVEYAMRGLPFIYSEINSDFDDKPYVLKVPQDDSSINISDVVNFYRSLNLSPSDIRRTVSDLSWDRQISSIVEHLK